MLGDNLAGGKTPPFIILKGINKVTGHIRREIDAKEGYPVDLEYGLQANAWMDEPLMLDWIEKVWKVAIKDNNITYLIIDECRTHLTEKVRADRKSVV